MESELFGHEKGAFTGAVERRAGCFELAQNGTVLLDEIGDMPVATQAKLAARAGRQPGAQAGRRAEIWLDVRHRRDQRPFGRRPQGGQVPRRSVLPAECVSISTPSLREHLEENLPVLAQALLEQLNRKHGTKVTDISAAVLDRIQTHSWPGNVRELRNVLERAMIVAGEGSIEPIASEFGRTTAPRPHPPPTTTLKIPVGYTIEQAERALIELTLEHTKNNKTRAAEILGISQKTLFNKLKEYGSQAAGLVQTAD